MIYRLPFLPFMIILTMLLIMAQGCKKEESAPTAPAQPGANNAFSFTTEQGAFSASGPFNATATSGSGAGFLNEKTISAYSISTFPIGSIAALAISPLDSFTVKSYTFPTLAAMTWSLNVDLSNQTAVVAAACITKSGMLTITSLSAERMQGTFSGTYSFQSDTSVTYNLTSGSFDLAR